MILSLDNPVRPYAWGSRTFIADLLGRPSPSDGPQAELWLGAHPAAPSLVYGRSLAELIAADPDRTLGHDVAAAFGPRLPFLLKVLAADQPLSLQVHPSAEQARTGFAREEAAGVPHDDPRRSYVDDWPKPELLCALTEFEALCGFRALPESTRLLETLVRHGAATLRPYAGSLRQPTDLRGLVADVLTLDADAGRRMVAEVAAGCRAADDAEFAPTYSWTARLADAYPGDVGVVVALLLNHVRLAPGEAIFLPAGNMHAYLRGAGVEVMASSDNVLRGGLTPKHVNVQELLRVLDPTPGPVRVLHPTTDGAERVYRTPAEQFQLSRLEVTGGEVPLHGGTPQILLCVDGTVEVCSLAGEGTQLARGGASFVGAATGSLQVAGSGVLFRAALPIGPKRYGNQGEGGQ